MNGLQVPTAAAQPLNSLIGDFLICRWAGIGLAGWRLVPVDDLSGSGFANGHLAFLSSCSNAAGTSLIDQTIHLASVFQRCGSAT
ncbi:hypothetical protein [Nonomuraea soli]|uniref:Uncharacterized protein n=1 Tax=Nonomuraea soli TaxID=1032476 RepID=A0A7W0CUT9_9ACTN|nr:hypothetical protein [Nonomuraea soli]MBA2897642.1 hypothetical protein [Nonomuraea soli]